MGSSCELRFDDIALLFQKSDVPDDFVCLFQGKLTAVSPRRADRMAR